MKQGFNKRTGSRIVGTCDTIPFCCAGISGFRDDGEVEYDGYTEVNWDGQTQDKNENGELLFLDEDGNAVPLSQIEFRDEDDES